MGCSCIGISRSSYDYSSVKLPNPSGYVRDRRYDG